MTEILFIRHGQTAGNLRRAYIGRTDEPLCPEGEAALREKLAAGLYPPAELVFASPLLRCRQTAALLYPGIEPVVIDELRECDFARFEGKTYQELADDAAYRKWLESGGTAPVPGGESLAEFRERCRRGFLLAAARIAQKPPQRAAFVVHGGTIMAVLAEFCGGAYYDYMVENGGGWRARLDADARLTQPEKLERYLNGRAEA